MMVTELKDAYKGKRVFITGDTGFKGSWLSLLLHDLGADVLGYALPPEREDDHFNLLGLENLIKHVDGNICELSSLQKVFQKFQPEFCFHLAAQALVRLSYEEPKQTFDTNVGGSVNVLEVCRNSSSLKSLIYVTSDKCYRNKEWIWGYRENDELGGHDPYSASKAACEILFSAYSDSFFLQKENFGAASVRAGNVIGGGDWSRDRIIPDCINALRNRRPVELRNPVATRPWQHVLEPLSGYISLAIKLCQNPKKYSGPWNFGPRSDSIRPVEQLAEAIVNIWGQGRTVKTPAGGDLHEANLLQLNCDKARFQLNWEPQWNFDQTVEETAKWYKRFADGKNAIDITRNQISKYLEGKND